MPSRRAPEGGPVVLPPLPDREIFKRDAEEALRQRARERETQQLDGLPAPLEDALAPGRGLARAPCSLAGAPASGAPLDADTAERSAVGPSTPGASSEGAAPAAAEGAATVRETVGASEE